jgi:hypothetical protein
VQIPNYALEKRSGYLGALMFLWSTDV